MDAHRLLDSPIANDSTHRAAAAGDATVLAGSNVDRRAESREPRAESREPRAESLDAEVGYGLGAPRGLVTPYTGVALTESGELWRAGARWQPGSAIEVSVEAALRERAGEASSESGIFLRGSTRW